MIDSALQDQEQTNQYLFKEPEEACFAVLLLRIFPEFIFDQLMSDQIYTATCGMCILRSIAIITVILIINHWLSLRKLKQLSITLAISQMASRNV